MPRERLYPVDFVPNGSRLKFINQVDNLLARYKCTCGVIKNIRMYKVAVGETVSCGCYQKEIATKNASTYNSLSSHPLWRKWRDVWNRCYNKNTKSYPNYGGKGVVMCDLWLNDFISFFNWCMENGWKPGLEIDKDIKARELKVKPTIYSPEMCQFVTGKKNSNNRSSNVYIEFNGTTKTIAEWSEEYSINQHTLGCRIRRGWPIDKALTMHTKLTGKRKC